MWPLIVTTREDKMPLSVGIATLAGEHSTDYSMMMAASIMSMAPIFILFFSMQRRVISGLASSGLKARPAFKLLLGASVETQRAFRRRLRRFL